MTALPEGEPRDVPAYLHEKWSVSLPIRSIHYFAITRQNAAGNLLLSEPELQQGSEVLDGADHLRNIGVLVVVPGNDLNLIGVPSIIIAV